MDRRPKLQTVLSNYCQNVYFQPPSSVVLKYPCIIYSRKKIVQRAADNLNYIVRVGYQITCISRDPDNPIPMTLMNSLQMIYWENEYVTENLYHTILTLYY